MGTSEDPGFIILAVHDVFDHIAKSQGQEFLVRVSYVEIYNEQLKDLLQPDGPPLRVAETKAKGIFVQGEKEVPAIIAAFSCW